jgi:DNA-binding PadR family transcriptional regulator
MTMPTLAVLDAIAARLAGGEQAWGLQICQVTGLGSGTVYPILERLEQAGWITAEWEAIQPSGRPRRRFYELTGLGRASYGEAVARRAARRLGEGRPHLRWAGQ